MCGRLQTPSLSPDQPGRRVFSIWTHFLSSLVLGVHIKGAKTSPSYPNILHGSTFHDFPDPAASQGRLLTCRLLDLPNRDSSTVAVIKPGICVVPPAHQVILIHQQA